MRHLVLVRHGESEINANNRRCRTFCGQFDTPLTDRGREQAREAGRQLAAADLRFAFAISSCRKRAKETASLLLEQLPYALTHLPPNSAFSERSLGVFEGRAEADIFRELPQYRDDERQNKFLADFVQKAPGGENFTEVTARSWLALEEIWNATHGDLLVVSHCNTLRCLLGRLLNLPHPEIVRLRVPNALPIALRCGRNLDDARLVHDKERHDAGGRRFPQ